VIYLAGRADDVNQLMKRLATDPGCNHPLTVLTGDDLTKAQFSTGETRMAPQATLYYIALTDPAVTARASDLAETAAAELGIVPRPPGGNPYEDDVFSDGSLALAYDATAALHAGAENAGATQDGGRGAVMAGLRAVELKNRATGTVDFRETRPLLATGTQPGHGINIIRVTREADGQPRLERICGRPAGDTAPLTGCRP
jgi:ABC-type branched-subunit amino acid transport system substrate-binding protein